VTELVEQLTALIDQRVAAAISGAELHDTDLLVSTPEAGRRLGVSRSTIVALCEAGELTYVEGLGRGRLVTVESLRAYVARNTVDHSRRRRIGRAS
jgi:excisionase family DNA binding protein